MRVFMKQWMLKKYYNHCHIIIAAVFCILFLLTRLIYLDKDVPPWEVTMYSSFDEMLYTIPAFNLYNYGGMRHQLIEWLPDDMLIVNNSLLGNLMTFISLKIFGNNYYGLRIPAIVASFVVVMILVKLLWLEIIRTQTTRKQINRTTQLIFCLTVLFILFNFPFLMASRIYEPTIIRMMSMLVLLYIATIVFDDNRLAKKSEVICFGLLVGSGVWFVYITNIFLIPAFGLFVFIYGVKKKFDIGIKYLISYVLGLTLSVIAISLVYYLIYEASYWKEIYGYIVDPKWGGRRVNVIGDTTVFSFLKAVSVNAHHYFETNIFYMNPVVRAMFLCLIPVFLYQAIKYRNNFHILVGLLLMTIFAQSLFMNDFHYRKLVLLFPLVVMAIFCAILEIIVLYKENDMKSTKFKYGYLFNYAIFGILMVYVLFKEFYGLDRYGDEVATPFGVSVGDKAVFHLSITILLTFMVYLFQKKKYLRKILLLSLGVLVFAPELYYDYKYIFGNPEFKHRDGMKSIAKHINGKKGIGFALGMRLYNKSHPYWNGAKHNYKNPQKYDLIFNRAINENQVDYEINRFRPNDKEYQQYEEKMNKYGFKLIRVFELPVYGKIELMMRN